MELKELASAFSTRFGVEGINAEDGQFAIDVDDIIMLVEETQGDTITVTGLVGEAPADGADVFASMLLDSNMSTFASEGFVFGRNGDNGNYVMMMRFDKMSLDIDVFSARLENFTNKLSDWRKALENFRPAAAIAKENASEAPSLFDNASSGFITV